MMTTTNKETSELVAVSAALAYARRDARDFRTFLARLERGLKIAGAHAGAIPPQREDFATPGGASMGYETPVSVRIGGGR